MSVKTRRNCLVLSALIIVVILVLIASVFRNSAKTKSLSWRPRHIFETSTKLLSPAIHVRSPDDCKNNCKVIHIKNYTSLLNELEQSKNEIAQLTLANRALGKKLRNSLQLNGDSHNASKANIPTIYMITPTYSRWTQKADLTRLCQTLMHVRKLHWIVVEDSVKKTELVTNFLQNCPVPSTHLIFRTSKKFRPSPSKRRKRKKPKVRKSRGVEQRNMALLWLRNTFKPGEEKGVVYFGDDDNTYDLRLFEEMRNIKKVGVWPVGIAGGLLYEGPVCKNGKVTHWHAAWGKDRKFQIDFAGVAIGLNTFLELKTLSVPMNGKPGYLENDFIAQVVSSKDDLEALADDCSKILVWHTQTKDPLVSLELSFIRNGTQSDPSVEV